MARDQHLPYDPDEFGKIICSKNVRAGKRTYFFDVKATQSDDYYLVITETRRRKNDDGTSSYSRHHMYLYKEDFGKFIDGLDEMINFIKTNKPDYFNEDK